MFRHCLRYLREYQRVPVPSKQAVGTEPLGARSLGDVFQIFLPVDELAQILFNDHFLSAIPGSDVSYKIF